MGHTAEEINGKELVFLNMRYPVLPFLYFHSIMVLIHIKDKRGAFPACRSDSGWLPNRILLKSLVLRKEDMTCAVLI
jgi:hypothetical protein